MAVLRVFPLFVLHPLTAMCGVRERPDFPLAGDGFLKIDYKSTMTVPTEKNAGGTLVQKWYACR
ncbi:MAG: hypothetical protein HZA67_11965 [Rhodospirillales bacterium]|nr:hypothetical protein [Rhodospirillales bacterium]